MTTMKNISSVSGSSLTTVSAPVIGDEYVLVKKAKDDEKKVQICDDEKKKIKAFAIGYGANLLKSGGGRFGACKAVLTYDFSFTPSTSSTIQTVVALAPVQDNAFTSYWSHLFTAMRMTQAEVEFDMTEFVNPVGHDFALSPVVVGFTPNAMATTQYYADVSDYKTAKFGGYSTAKPIIRYKIPGNWIVGWTASSEASTVYTYQPKWGSTQMTGGVSLLTGFVHFASQKVMFDTERNVIGRLRMWMEFKGQL